MSLYRLSEKSTIQVLKLLEQENDYDAISKLRRCSKQLNEIVVRTEFHLVNAREIRLQSYKHTRVIAGYVLCEVPKRKKPALQEKYEEDLGFGSENDFSVSKDGTPTVHKKYMFYKRLTVTKDTSATLFEQLQPVFDKVKNVRQISLIGTKLQFGAKFAELSKLFVDKTRKTEVLHIQIGPTIMAANYFFDFLKMFPNLRSLSLSGCFDRSWINLEHLLTLNGHIRINPNRTSSLYGSLVTFPYEPRNSVFNDDVLAVWMANQPRSVDINGNLTAFTFEALWATIQEFAKREFDTFCTTQRVFDFGILVWTADIERKIEIATKVEGYIWNITELAENIRIVQVQNTQKTVLVGITLQKRAEKYNYGNILKSMRNLRETLAQTVDDEVSEQMQKQILSTITDIDIQICDYEEQKDKRKTVPEPVEGHARRQPPTPFSLAGEPLRRLWARRSEQRELFQKNYFAAVDKIRDTNREVRSPEEMLFERMVLAFVPEFNGSQENGAEATTESWTKMITGMLWSPWNNSLRAELNSVDEQKTEKRFTKAALNKEIDRIEHLMLDLLDNE